MNITWSSKGTPVINMDNFYINFTSDTEIKWLVVGGKSTASGYTTTERAMIPVRLTLAAIPVAIRKNVDKKLIKKIGGVIRKYVNDKGTINRKHLKSIINEIEA